MPTYTAETLDLSRLPPFRLVAVDYEAELTGLLASIRARAAARGLDFDVGATEFDPLVIMAEEFAHTKELTLQMINDAGKQLTVSYGFGPALDHLAATYYADIGLRREIMVPATDNTPAILETDEQFKQRMALAAQARSPGSLGGYEFLALTASRQAQKPLLDARALNHASGLVRPGTILISLFGDEQYEAAGIAAATAVLLDRDEKLATDTLVIQAAPRLPYTIKATIDVAQGPDSTVVLKNAKDSLAKYLDQRRAIGRTITTSGLYAALTVGGVDRVNLQEPAHDVNPGQAGLAVLSAPADVQVTL